MVLNVIHILIHTTTISTANASVLRVLKASFVTNQKVIAFWDEKRVQMGGYVLMQHGT